MFRVSEHPSSGVLKTVTAASGILLHLVGLLLTLIEIVNKIIIVAFSRLFISLYQ